MDNPQREVVDFGMTIKQMEAYKPGYMSNIAYAMQILSDAQQSIDKYEPVVVKQRINKAKYFLALEMQRLDSQIITDSSGDSYVR